MRIYIYFVRIDSKFV